MSEDAQNRGSAAPTPDPASGDFEGLERAGEALGQALGGVLAGAKRLLTAPRPGAGAAGAAVAGGGSALARADRLVSSAAGKLGVYSYGARLRIRRSLARAREEVEDVWAEAEAVRRGARGGAMARGAPAEGETGGEEWEEAPEGSRQPPAPRGG